MTTSGEAACADLVTVLRQALIALGRAGQPEDANRLAARAWWCLRDRSPDQAERVNRTMHILARLEASPDQSSPNQASSNQASSNHGGDHR